MSTSPATGRTTRCAMRSTRILQWPARRWRSLRRARVDDAFDARFSAIGAPLSLPHPQPPRAAGDLKAGRVWHVPRPLDETAMHAAAQALVGRHDFTTFRSVQCQAKSPVKTLDRLDVTREGDIDRNPRLGALVPAQPGALHGRHAEARRRRRMDAGPMSRRRWRPRTAPPAARWRRPQGLYLMRVDYAPAGRSGRRAAPEARTARPARRRTCRRRRRWRSPRRGRWRRW